MMSMAKVQSNILNNMASNSILCSDFIKNKGLSAASDSSEVLI